MKEIVIGAKSNSYNFQLSSENKKAISPFSSPGFSSQQIKST